MSRSRLPYVREMIARMGLGAFLEAELAAVKTRPVPMQLADRFAKPEARLTPHDVRILVLRAQGLTRKEVADVLGCSPETVKSHLHTTYDKLGGARNIAHALALATEKGYLA